MRREASRRLVGAVREQPDQLPNETEGAAGATRRRKGRWVDERAHARDDDGLAVYHAWGSVARGF